MFVLRVPLKLVRTHINYRFTKPPVLKNYLSLFAPITSDECHTSFHLNGISRATRNAKQAKIINWKILVNTQVVGFEPTNFNLRSGILIHWTF